MNQESLVDVKNLSGFFLNKKANSLNLLMINEELEKLKYPIGQFHCPKEITKLHIRDWIQVLENLPTRLEKLVENLDDEQLNTPYRPGGWTIREVIHHVSDSHHHSYIRFKWAMTEDNPVIKAYNEQDWANLHDYTSSIKISQLHLRAVHAKLVQFIKGLKDSDLERTFIHPEGNRTVKLKENLGIYAWHSNHHYAHIESVMKKKDWI